VPTLLCKASSQSPSDWDWYPNVSRLTLIALV
jgi:hypothetical protein